MKQRGGVSYTRETAALGKVKTRDSPSQGLGEGWSGLSGGVACDRGEDCTVVGVSSAGIYTPVQAPGIDIVTT